jgi:hypothetical protein
MAQPDAEGLIGRTIDKLVAKAEACLLERDRLHEAIKQHRASVLSAYTDTDHEIALRKAIDQADNRLWSMVFSGKPKTRKTK